MSTEDKALDGNKTALTHRVTATAAAYLDGIGCKPIESEVGVARGWIADLASFVYPTRTEWKKGKLNKRFNGGGFSEYVSKYGFLLTVLVEVKTTLADLKKDIERKFEAKQLPAHLCYIAAPMTLEKEIVRLPLYWGYILTTKHGDKVRRSYAPKVFPQHPGEVADFVAEVAIRRAHRTRYTEMRALMKAYRAKDNQDRKTWKLAGAIRATLDYLTNKGWMEHESLEEAFKSEGIPMPRMTEEQIADLEALRCKRPKRRRSA